MLFAGDVCMNIMGLGDLVGFESLKEGRASQRKVAGLWFDAAGSAMACLSPVMRQRVSAISGARNRLPDIGDACYGSEAAGRPVLDRAELAASGHALGKERLGRRGGYCRQAYAGERSGPDPLRGAVAACGMAQDLDLSLLGAMTARVTLDDVSDAARDIRDIGCQLSLAVPPFFSTTYEACAGERRANVSSPGPSFKQTKSHFLKRLQNSMDERRPDCQSAVHHHW